MRTLFIYYFIHLFNKENESIQFLLYVPLAINLTYCLYVPNTERIAFVIHGSGFFVFICIGKVYERRTLIFGINQKKKNDRINFAYRSLNIKLNVKWCNSKKRKLISSQINLSIVPRVFFLCEKIRNRNEKQSVVVVMSVRTFFKKTINGKTPNKKCVTQ